MVYLVSFGIFSLQSTNVVPWVFGAVNRQYEATQGTRVSYKMLRNRCFIIFLFYYYNNILRRERCRLAHYVIFSSFIFFFITIIAWDCPLGIDHNHEPARGACASTKAVTSYFLSYIFFFLLLQPMWISIPHHQCLLNYLWYNESESEICRLLANRPTILYKIMVCNTISHHKPFDKITLQKILQWFW